MSELDELRATPVPRPPALCRRLARRVDSTWGFIAYGLVWLCCTCAFATLGLLVGVTLTGGEQGPVARAVVVVLWLGSFVGGWVPFVRWVRRRRAGATRLFREGTFVDAQVHSVQHLWVRGVAITRAVLHAADDGGAHRIGLSLGGHPEVPTVGTAMPVLLVRGYGYCAAFPSDGRFVTCSRADA